MSLTTDSDTSIARDNGLLSFSTMKFSTQEEFGLRCLLRIAHTGDGGSLTIPEISQAEGLSDANVAKILRLLRHGGFVESTRGRQGGYSLARPADQITISDVLHALGGRLVEDDFCESYSGGQALCVHSVDCTVLSLWQTIQNAVDGVLGHTRLSDLLPPAADVSGLVPHTIALPEH